MLPVRSVAAAPGFGSSAAEEARRAEDPVAAGRLDARGVDRAGEAATLAEAEEPGEGQRDHETGRERGEHGHEDVRRLQRRADAARTVGPPHGTMLSVPFMVPRRR
jgi:hypothetical protein